MRIWTSRSLTLLVQRCSHTRLFTPAVPCLFTLAVPTNNTVRWADSVVFVYPTWWFNMPAILKGYLDRSLCLGGAFDIPTTKDDITAMNGAAAAPKHKGYREGGRVRPDHYSIEEGITASNGTASCQKESDTGGGGVNGEPTHHLALPPPPRGLIPLFTNLIHPPPFSPPRSHPPSYQRKTRGRHLHLRRPTAHRLPRRRQRPQHNRHRRPSRLPPTLHLPILGLVPDGGVDAAATRGIPGRSARGHCKRVLIPGGARGRDETIARRRERIRTTYR